MASNNEILCPRSGEVCDVREACLLAKEQSERDMPRPITWLDRLGMAVSVGTPGGGINLAQVALCRIVAEKEESDEQKRHLLQRVIGSADEVLGVSLCGGHCIVESALEQSKYTELAGAVDEILVQRETSTN